MQNRLFAKHPELYVVMASALLAIFGATGKSSFTIVLLVFLRFLIPSLILMVKQGKKNLQTIKAIKPLTWLRVVFVIISQYTFFYSIKHTTLLNANALLNSAPIFVVLIDMFVSKSFSLAKIAGVILGFIGVIFIIRPDIHALDIAVLMGLASGFSWAMSNYLQDKLVKSVSSFDCAYHYYFIGTFISFIILFLSGQVGELKSIFTWDQIEIMALFSATTIGFQLLMGKAYQHKAASTLSTYLYLTVFFSAIIGSLFFKESITLFSIIGTVFILFGIMTVNSTFLSTLNLTGFLAKR